MLCILGSTAKPRMVVFTKFFWPEGGGAELATYLIIKDIYSKHFNIIIVSSTEKPKAYVLRYCRYIHWHALKTKFKPLEWFKLIVNTKYIRKLIEQADIVYIPSHTLLPLAIIAKKIKPSIKVVLHLHNYQPLTYTSIILASRKPDLTTDLIVECGEHDSLLRAIASGFGHYINKVNVLALHSADRVICVSKRQYEILAKYIPAMRNKAFIVYNPPPPLPNIEKKLNSYPTILFSGVGSFVKGSHLAIEVLAKIITTRNCRAYFVCGYSTSTHQHKFLEKVASKFRDKLIILNKVPHEKFITLHKYIWAILFPSICEEPLPYIIVESCLLGTLPIAAKVGGVSEVLEGTPAEEYLFAPGNIEEFMQKIELLTILSKEQLVDKGAKLSREVRKRININIIRRRLITLMQDCILSA